MDICITAATALLYHLSMGCFYHILSVLSSINGMNKFTMPMIVVQIFIEAGNIPFLDSITCNFQKCHTKNSTTIVDVPFS